MRSTRVPFASVSKSTDFAGRHRLSKLEAEVGELKSEDGDEGRRQSAARPFGLYFCSRTSIWQGIRSKNNSPCGGRLFVHLFSMTNRRNEEDEKYMLL